jgi:hypothetical protein
MRDVCASPCLIVEKRKILFIQDKIALFGGREYGYLVSTTTSVVDNFYSIRSNLLVLQDNKS